MPSPFTRAARGSEVGVAAGVVGIGGLVALARTAEGCVKVDSGEGDSGAAVFCETALLHAARKAAIMDIKMPVFKAHLILTIILPIIPVLTDAGGGLTKTQGWCES
jgi:hypothetical protein